jgi:hypothetical protein
MLIALSGLTNEDNNNNDHEVTTTNHNLFSTPSKSVTRNVIHSTGYVNQHHLQIYRDAQEWAEQDMKSASFKGFCSSSTAARMMAHLRYSPPFMRVTLNDVLKCDRKSMFLLVYMCQVKR